MNTKNMGCPNHDVETVEGPLGLSLLQPKRGYRYSEDALLLADFAAPGPRATVCDLGTGSGIIALVLARKGAARKVVGIELQPSLARLARRNVEMNGLEDWVEIVEMDLRRVRERFRCRTFDYVVSNPPFMKARAGKVTPNAEKALARHELACTMEDVLDAAAYLLKPTGRASLVYPAERTAELCGKARARRLEPKRLRFVHPVAGRNAELVLAELHKWGRTGVAVMPPLLGGGQP